MSLEVTINGIKLQPYEWEEEDENNYTLTVDAKISVEAYKRLTELRLNAAKHVNYFDVMINDYIKMMRFGRVMYSEHDSYIKIRLTLVEKNYKEDGDKHYAEPGREHLLETVSQLQLTNRKLVQLLQEKGLLSEEEAESIRVHSVDEVLNKEFQF